MSSNIREELQRYELQSIVNTIKDALSKEEQRIIKLNKTSSPKERQHLERHFTTER